MKTAEQLKVKTKVIKDALQFRIDSEKDPVIRAKCYRLCAISSADMI